jgi:hypothetical protein
VDQTEGFFKGFLCFLNEHLGFVCSGSRQNAEREAPLSVCSVAACAIERSLRLVFNFSSTKGLELP